MAGVLSLMVRYIMVLRFVVGGVVFLLVLLLVKFLIFPLTYYGYVEKPSGEVNVGDGVYDLSPPIDGCFDTCWGKTNGSYCKVYSRKYDKCEYRCFGLLHNNCRGLIIFPKRAW